MKNSFETLRNYALYFTMTMAIVLAIIWAITGFGDPTAGSASTIFWAVFYLLCAGGVTMGVMYMVHLLRKK